MKLLSDRVRILAAVFVAAITIHGWSAAAQPNPYRVVENWAKLPKSRIWGDVSGVGVDRDGNVWVVDRCTANSCSGSNQDPILVFDPSGKLLKSFGGGMFAYAHGLFLDKEGNVWVTDGRGKDGKGYQVFKFNAEGKVLLTLGKAGIAGDGPDTFTGPSAVVVAPHGDIFVADGHRQVLPGAAGDGDEEESTDALNSRVVKFSKDGKFIKAWGKKGRAPGEFNAPHAIAMDSRGRLFVGDEHNNRIQIFDQDGKFLEEWKQFGRPSGVSIDANDNIYVADANSNQKINPGVQEGIRIGSVKDGIVKVFIPHLGPEEQPTSRTECAAADSMGNVYATERHTHNFRKYARN